MDCFHFPILSRKVKAQTHFTRSLLFSLFLFFLCVCPLCPKENTPRPPLAPQMRINRREQQLSSQVERGREKYLDLLLVAAKTSFTPVQEVNKTPTAIKHSRVHPGRRGRAFLEPGDRDR
ncbi:hypothetical protein CEXT_117371 [Caerostris extrusa]|uniref:Uncharacterized protein n=1 Tax=Caerostris extrusa TaxID=172846 RepID=A0AAV4XD96_CAEEX|nr:hypothetical protein CEXT_117371 [Caerostris extrusa]